MDTIAIHRLHERVQFVFTNSYDKNIGMHPTNGDPIRLGPPKIVSAVHDVVLDLDRAIALRTEVAAGGSFVEFSYWDYRGTSCIRVRQYGDPFHSKQNGVGLTLLQVGCALASIDLDDLRREPFLFALDNAIIGEEATCSQ
ncbi:MAG: hypothetical protein ACYC8W_07815 [Candidatus Tyrphobacter sp.]